MVTGCDARAMLVNGDPAPGAKLLKENLKVYQLADAKIHLQ